MKFHLLKHQYFWCIESNVVLPREGTPFAYFLYQPPWYITSDRNYIGTHQTGDILFGGLIESHGGGSGCFISKDRSPDDLYAIESSLKNFKDLLIAKGFKCIT